MSQTIQVVQAFDRAVVAEIPADDAQALETKLAAAAGVMRNRDAWLKPYQRSAILLRTAGLLEARQAHFAKLIAQEGGKPLTDAAAEVQRALDGLHNAADEIRNLAGREIPMGLTPASEGRWAFTTKEPIGVVAAISAFNHPLNLIVHQVAPAVAVGCAVIVKPAAATPLSCIEFVALLREAGLAEPWCQTFITEDNALSERFATDPRVAFLSFIGSARVGWYLRSKLAPGTRCSFEHGGAAPAIVDRSAKLDRIIEPMVKGGYYHAGQVCVSTQRIFVHTDLLNDFVERLATRVQALRVGDPLLPETEVGPLINPAILIEPPADAKVSQLEVFGPVTCVYGFQDLDAAIEIANSLPFAFQASVFSTDIGPAMRAARRLDASTVLINDHTAFRTDWMPFAGRRQSGYGIGGIPWSMEDMCQEKMLVLRHDG
jgi:acyl-CoA reductase-like NAD-dependent aldehyde dehydrogenase